MEEVLVLLGADPFGIEPVSLPASDRGAVGLAQRHWAGSLPARVRGGDPRAAAYARAAGLIEAPWADEASCEADWILLGRGACGQEGDLFAARLAEQSQASLIYDVVDLEREGAKLRVMRDLGHGNRDEWVVSAPAVLVVADSVRRVGYISANRLSRSMEESPRERESHDMRGWHPTVPRVKLGEYADRIQGTATDRMNRLLGADDKPDARRASLIQDEAVVCAEHMIRYLKHHGFLGQSADEGEDPARPEWQSDAASPVPQDPMSTGVAPDTPALPPALMRGPRRFGASHVEIRGPFRRPEEHS